MANILYIDDGEMGRECISAVLTELGKHTVLTAANATEAKEFLKTQPFDLVVSDYLLGTGQENGLNILDYMRRQNIRTPFILYSGSIDAAEGNRLYRKLASDISKVLCRGGAKEDISELLNAVQEVVERYQTLPHDSTSLLAGRE